jgi:hypothetical protein
MLGNSLILVIVICGGLALFVEIVMACKEILADYFAFQRRLTSMSSTE